MVKKTQLDVKMELLRQVFAQQLVSGNWGSPVQANLASWAWEMIQTSAAKEGVLEQRLRRVANRHLALVAGTEMPVEEATDEERAMADWLSRQYPLPGVE